MSLVRGARMLYDGLLRVEVVRELGDGTAIVKVGADSRVVDVNRLTEVEG